MQRLGKYLIWIACCLLSIVSIVPTYAYQNPNEYATSLSWSPDSTAFAEGRLWDGCESIAEDYPGLNITEARQYDRMWLQRFVPTDCTITSVDWSPDGKKLLSTSLDGEASVWNVESGELIVMAQQAEPQYGFAKWKPDNREILSGTFTDTFEIWNPRTGERIRTLPFNGTSADWSPDGKQLVVGSVSENTVYIYEYASGKERLSLVGHSAGITNVSWSPDGNKLGSTSEDGTAKIWDATNGQLITTFDRHMGAVQSIDWNPVLEHVVTTGVDGTARVWEIASAEELDVYDNVDESAVWSPDGSMIAMGSINRYGDLSAMLTPAPVVYLQPPPITYISALAWSPDGQQIAVGYSTDFCLPAPNLYWVYLIDAETREVEGHLSGSRCDVTSVDWSPDGSKLAASSLEGLGTRVWNVATRTLIMTSLQGGQGFQMVKWRPPEGLEIARSAAYGNGFAVLDATTGAMTVDGRANANFIDWSPDGSKIVTGGHMDFLVNVVDMVAEQPIMSLSGHTDFVHSVDWSPDGDKLVSASGDGTVRVWDAHSGEHLLTINANVGKVRWSPDSSRLATASYDDGAQIWDATTGELLASFSYPGRVAAVDWSPDGKQVVYGGIRDDRQDPKIEIADVADLPIP